MRELRSGAEDGGDCGLRNDAEDGGDCGLWNGAEDGGDCGLWNGAEDGGDYAYRASNGLRTPSTPVWATWV